MAAKLKEGAGGKKGTSGVAGEPFIFSISGGRPRDGGENTPHGWVGYFFLTLAIPITSIQGVFVINEGAHSRKRKR